MIISNISISILIACGLTVIHAAFDVILKDRLLKRLIYQEDEEWDRVVRWVLMGPSPTPGWPLVWLGVQLDFVLWLDYHYGYANPRILRPGKIPEQHLLVVAGLSLLLLATALFVYIQIDQAWIKQKVMITLRREGLAPALTAIKRFESARWSATKPRLMALLGVLSTAAPLYLLIRHI